MLTQATLTFDNLAVLRRKTESVSDFLQSQLLHHIETIRSLFSPENLLGQFDSERELMLTNKSVSEIREGYKQFIGKPFELPRDFEVEALTQVGNRLQLGRADYFHNISIGSRTKGVLISSPVRWILTYRSAYNPTELRQVLSGAEEKQTAQVQQFVLNALVLKALVERNRGLKDLFAALRYDIEITPSPEFNNLPLVSIVAPLPSFRPSDELILSATDFSGVAAFIELLDVDAVHAMQDPLKTQIEALLASS